MHTLKERALHPRRRNRYQTFRALERHLVRRASAGEFFGIAGRNGSGKSTLLKCIAGHLRVRRRHLVPRPAVDADRARRRLQHGTRGARQRGAERDHDGALAQGGAQALRQRDRVRRARGVPELKLKNYSSGMQVRLAFSVAIQVDADILLIDEVLAVGDAAFQQKCFDVFHPMRAEGKTIVFVTHDMGAMQRFCHRALLLERGSMVHLGDTELRSRTDISSSTSAASPNAGAAVDGVPGRWRRTSARGMGRGRGRQAPDRGAPGRSDHAARARAIPRSTSRIPRPECTFTTRIRRR